MPEAISRKQKRRVTCERYGVSVRTVKRWELNPDLNFPRPTIINGQYYDDPDRLADWDRLREKTST